MEGDEYSNKKLAVKKFKGVVERDITFEDYKECLFKKEEKIKHVNFIFSFKHKLYT